MLVSQRTDDASQSTNNAQPCCCAWFLAHVHAPAMHVHQHSNSATLTTKQLPRRNEATTPDSAGQLQPHNALPLATRPDAPPPMRARQAHTARLANDPTPPIHDKPQLHSTSAPGAAADSCCMAAAPTLCGRRERLAKAVSRMLLCCHMPGCPNDTAAGQEARTENAAECWVRALAVCWRGR